MGNQQFLKIHKHLMKSKKGGGVISKKSQKGKVTHKWVFGYWQKRKISVEDFISDCCNGLPESN